MATKDHPGRNSATDDRELAALARQVIDANRYLVLATADQHGVPWVSPVWYAHAGYGEFLWVRSAGQALAQHRGPAAGEHRDLRFERAGQRVPAVYLCGTACVVTGSGLERSIELYSRRSQEQGLPEWTLADVRAPARPRLYRAVAAEQFVLQAGRRRPDPGQCGITCGEQEGDAYIPQGPCRRAWAGAWPRPASLRT